jgi:hypothetical protein
LLTLEQEIHHIASLPFATDFQAQMTTELSKYKTYADLEIMSLDEISLCDFWIKYQLDLPNLFIGAMEAALIMPSSGAAERVFSLLTQCFSDKQGRALED